MAVGNRRFVRATDRLRAAGITLPEMAKELGIAYTTIRAYRLEPSSSAYRSPPPGWESVLAGCARRRATQLAVLAERLDGDAQRL